MNKGTIVALTSLAVYGGVDFIAYKLGHTLNRGYFYTAIAYLAYQLGERS